MVATMEGQGTIGSSLIDRRVEANTTCLAFAPKTTTTTTGFAVHLRCHVSKYIRAGHGKKLTHTYRGGGAEASCCLICVPDGGEDGVRDALRGMLKSIRALQDLGLTDAEWESIVPEDVVPQLADPQARASHAAATIDLAVVRRVRYDTARMLMTACKEAGDGDEGDAEAECSVCYDALPLRGEEEEAVVVLPGCAHAFHRRCISEWFGRKPTCPLCRGDVVKHLDPELHKHIADFTDAM